MQKGCAVDIKLFSDHVKVYRETTDVVFDVNTKIDGANATLEEIYDFLREHLFSDGGGATGGGVASVTGSLVSGTSENPVIDNPLLEMHRVIIVNEGNRTITDFNNTVALVRNVLEEINSFTLTWEGLDTETDRKIIMFTFDCDNITHVAGSGVTLNNLPTSCRNGQAIEVVYDKFFNTWDLVGKVLPSGSNEKIIGFDNLGNPKAIIIGVEQLSDIGGFPAFANGVYVATAMNSTTKTGFLSFIEFSTTTPKSGTFPTYSTGGVLKVANAVADDDAVNLGQLKTIPATYLNATGTRSSTTYLAGDNTWKTIPTTPLAPTINNNVARTFGSNFTISTTRNALVNYSITLNAEIILASGTASGSAYLEYSTNAGSSWIIVSNVKNNFGAGVVTLVAYQTSVDFVLSGFIPANALVRIRTSLTSNASATYIRGQEVLM